MAHITVAEAQAWAESSKLTLSFLNTDLEKQVSSQVLARLSGAYDTTLWTDEADTPQVVRSIIAMYYIAWHYDKVFSADATTEPDDYATRLRRWADLLIVSLIDGTTEIPGEATQTGSPTFYPNDASSALEPTTEDPSLGPAAFTMGTVW